MYPTLICYVTRNTSYQTEILRLLESCAKWGLPYSVDTREATGSWTANCSRKSDYVQWKRKQVKGPVVWIDADAEFMEDPVLLGQLQGVDVAARHRMGSLNSTLVYFGTGSQVDDLVDRWVDICKADRGRWDQACLQQAIEEAGDKIIFKEMPPEYCCIDRLDRRVKKPVVYAHQASRRFKKQVRHVGAPENFVQ